MDINLLLHRHQLAMMHVASAKRAPDRLAGRVRADHFEFSMDEFREAAGLDRYLWPVDHGSSPRPVPNGKASIHA